MNNNKKISFGKGECLLVNNEIKQKIIDYLYDKVDLSKHRYIILNNVQKLKFLSENEHYVSPNFKGFNYLLILTTFNNKKYCVAIDRKKLSYQKSQLDMRTLQLFQINMRTSEKMFDGTILDGKLIQNNNNYLFLIQDCFYMMGNPMLKMEMSNKISYLDSILKSNLNNNCNNNFTFKLNKLYVYDELEEMINNLHTLSIPTNGITFFPKQSGIIVIHTEKKAEKVNITTNNEVIDNSSFHIIHDYINFLKSRTYSYEQNGKSGKFWISRTPIYDVYDLSEKENGEKIGIACIPNLKISHMCDEKIKDTPVKFNCIFSNKFKKWIPISVC